MAGPMMLLSPDFREFAALLISHEARFLIVGGHAVGVHGHPRYTGDTDVWVDHSVENASRVFAALDAFGFGGIGVTEEDFSEPDRVVQLGFPPNRIDILTSLKGVEFEPCFAAREDVESDGIRLPVIGIDCLRTNKLAVGRPQDLADLDHLK